jgi:NADP-dependent 3-hydroxy acid dehydrogenase YdfG/DNA-binding CsgD family transcriptional regulator
VARRAERLEALSRETGAIAAPCDITSDADVAALRDRVLGEQGRVDALLNISGGARGTDWVAEAKDEDWEWMYRVNVLGTMRVTRAFLPALRENGEGTFLNLTSLASQRSYEGGGGYNAAKFAQHGMIEALRLEEAEHNIRVVEVAPGLVQTPEFSLMRLGGDAEAAARVYAGVAAPLPLPYEHARVDFAHGTTLRRAGRRRDAATLLASARQSFAALGARVYVERCDRELKTARPAPRGAERGTEHLTEQERTVAAHVASGLTNKEVAAAMLLSVKTVQFHLTRVYAKLGVRSRSELAARFAREPEQR